MASCEIACIDGSLTISGGIVARRNGETIEAAIKRVDDLLYATRGKRLLCKHTVLSRGKWVLTEEHQQSLDKIADPVD